MSTVTIYQGHVLDVASKLPTNSVSMCCTSPPYWNLRDYKAEPQVWDGADGCVHEWGNQIIRDHGNAGSRSNLTSGPQHRIDSYRQGQFCHLCGAWRGSLGLEPEPDMFVRHLVSCFEALRPALRDDATLWVNVGDSYCGTGYGKGTGNFKLRDVPTAMKPASPVPEGLRHGDLCGIPWRFAMAMQAAGWTLRSSIIWAKGISFQKKPRLEKIAQLAKGIESFLLFLPLDTAEKVREQISQIMGLCRPPSGSVMPESVSGTRWERHRVKVGNRGRGQSRNEVSQFQDHSGNAVKSDAEWIDCPGCKKCAPHGGLVLRRGSYRPTRAYEMVFMFTKGDHYFCDGESGREQGCFDGRNDTVCKGSEKYEGGAGLPITANVQGVHKVRNVWAIGTKSFRGAHFATYPERLVEPIIRIATPEHGVCPKCGAPWARVVQRGEKWYAINTEDQIAKGGNKGQKTGGFSAEYETLGWRATCECPAAEPVPAVVLDPFAGSFTTCLAAAKLGRDSIGIELSPQYCAMGEARLKAECGMLVEVQHGEA